MVRWLFNSVGVAVIVTLLTTLFCSMASYAIAKLKFRYRTIIYIYFLVGLMVPGEATIVALFVWANKLHLIDSYWGLILPALAGSMNIIIMSSFLEGIPNDLIEAARIDGAGEFRTYKVAGGEKSAEPHISRVFAILEVVAQHAPWLVALIVAAKASSGRHPDKSVVGNPVFHHYVDYASGE